MQSEAPLQRQLHLLDFLIRDLTVDVLSSLQENEFDISEDR